MADNTKKNTDTKKSELTDYEKDLRMESVLIEDDIENERRAITEDEARIILENPKLFDYIIEEEFSKKIVGEKDNLKAIFLVACGIFVKEPQIASFNLCVNSESGAGKDYNVKNVLRIFPKELVETRSRISPTAFTYWHNSKKEPDWTWSGKVCYLQDVSNFILNSEVFKVMVSDDTKSTIVKDQRAEDIEIKGKPVMIITTASANPKNELLRRFPILTLDESRDQTRAIINWQSEQARKGKKEKNPYTKAITQALGYLKQVDVRIPYADILSKAYTSEHIIMRTHYQRMLDFINASCAFHQYQRETDEDGYLLATPEDYELARIAMRQTSQNALMIPLTKRQDKLLSLIRDEFKEDWFSASELSGKCKFLSQKSVYTYLDRLQENFLDTDLFTEEQSKKPVKKYRLKAVVNIDIPSYDDCQNITNNKSDSNDSIDSNVTNNQDNN